MPARRRRDAGGRAAVWGAFGRQAVPRAAAATIRHSQRATGAATDRRTAGHEHSCAGQCEHQGGAAQTNGGGNGGGGAGGRGRAVALAWPGALGGWRRALDM
eukprot:3798192-Prymnesium_polylepis.1